MESHRRYRIAGTTVADHDPALANLLETAYAARLRPVCLCCDTGVAMYIARQAEQLVIKRMPLSGRDHDPSCPSHEPPYELSGLGPLIGGAIRLDEASGLTSLKLDFALAKRDRATATAPGPSDSGSVKSETQKLTPRALLHYLWQESGLTEWTARWEGKRHWHQVHRHLLDAVATMTVGGVGLAGRLFVPEPFRIEDRAAIEQRRAAELARLCTVTAAGRPLTILVGEVKEFTGARSGQRIVIKQMPGYPVVMVEDTWRRLQRRYASELELWHADESTHLIAIATIGVTGSGLTTVEEVSLMVVTQHWIPIESIHEARLVARLATLRVKSVKGLRFNLAADRPLACAMLPQLRPMPMALYIVPPGADTAFEALQSEMIAARRDVGAWIWRVADGAMPDLPADEFAKGLEADGGLSPPA
jgi:hypothetical protein